MNIGELKKLIITKVEPLEGTTPDMLKVMHRGLFLTDDETILKSQNVDASSVFKVKVRKVEGCFRGDSEVRMANGESRRI